MEPALSAAPVERLVSVPVAFRVYEPTHDIVHIKGINTYASLCGLTDDAYCGRPDSEQLKYGVRRPVSCESCRQVAIHAAKFVAR